MQINTHFALLITIVP